MTLTTDQVWDSFSRQLRLFILNRISDQDDAEDILQEVFIKIHNNLDRLQDQDRLAPWLYGIARNSVIDFYRAKRPVEGRIEVRLYEQLEALPVDPEPLEAEPAARIAAGLKYMLECLPEKYRQALWLSELQGLKQAELADQLGISVSGAKSRLQRGRVMLRRALLDCCHFEFDRRGGIIDYSPRPDCCEHC